MKSTNFYSNQRGVALVLALLLLFVLITIGVAGFGNTHLQERSASNARLQAEAFKAASAGATNAINWFQDNRDRTDIGIPDTLCGASGHAGWYDGDGNPIATDWVSAGAIGQASLDQRMYCLADAYPCNEDVEVDCSIVARPPRSQLFVQSRGEVTVDGKVVAHRDVEVRLSKGQDGEPGDGCGAICFPTCDINTDDTVFPNSNSFQVDGNTGPAITVGTGCDPSGADTITDMIKDQRIGNYIGGIHDSPAGSPWNSPTLVEQFRAEVEAAAAAASSCGNCYYPDADGDGVGLDISGNIEFGTLEFPQITYIEGNADIGGSISGAGILVVNGDLLMNGTPDYQGLIVVLGGEWIIDGGGKGGNPGNDQSTSGGSVVVLNAPGDGTFGQITFDNTGGGNALYRYDCEVLKAMRELLSGTAQDIWNPTCNPVPDLFFLGPERIIIASWRENIGWREELIAE